MNTTTTQDTHDADPANMLIRAGYLHGLAIRLGLAGEDLEMMLRASRSLLCGASALTQIDAWLATMPSEFERGDPVHDEKEGILVRFRRGEWRGPAR